MKRNLLITLTSTIVGVLASLVIYDIYKSKVQNNLDDKTLKVSGKPGQTEDLDELDKMNNAEMVDRKSTRLNSSHVAISYAVFCLKKKKKQKNRKANPTTETKK